MEFENLLEPEVAAAAVVVAAVASPPVRRAVRRGAIYGLAGLIVAGDAVSSFAKGVGRGMQAATAGMTVNTHANGNGTARTEEQSAHADVH
jgi:hypothetical protein